ncbi:MAG: hypothetical protein ACKKL6_00530 [Candidatus Komeilibacteria bacterium]
MSYKEYKKALLVVGVIIIATMFFLVDKNQNDIDTEVVDENILDSSEKKIVDDYKTTSKDGVLELALRDYGSVDSNYQTGDGWGGKLNDLVLRNIETGQETILVKSGQADDEGHEIINIMNPIFSLDDKNVYFLTQSWTTSNAIFSVNIDSGKINFISDGNYLDIVKNGEYKGNLITLKHKYYDDPDGGSYDNYYIIDHNNGSELKDLGSWGEWDSKNEFPNGIY